VRAGRFTGRMKTGWVILIVAAMLTAGCASTDSAKYGEVPGPSQAPATPAVASPPPTPVTEPTNSASPKTGLAENVKNFFGNLTKKEEVQFGEVPGPSQTKLALPPPTVAVSVEPTNAPPPKMVEAKPKPTPPPVVKTTAPPTIKAKTPPQEQAPIVTPDNSQTGKVVKFNEAARIVVLEFPLTNLPGPERQLFIYRNDLKVGEVKTSRWQNREYVVADLVSGEAKEGDVVRDR
jgi:hypothetical protein